MFLNPVTPKNIDRLKQESIGDQREYFKKLLARVRTEDPLYALLINTISRNSKARLAKKGTIGAEELEKLITDTCLLAFRLLELAAVEGGARQVATILMEDPEMDTFLPSRIEAIVHTNMMFNKLGVKKKVKKEDK
ncbi:MAG: hypothetical protein A2845_05255 [Candidatus Lloydbacteria bacterium RIFCSPHIGHO2_01_FULL_49_22]|uniref:Uncharacterized protein n=1 Tax=Candidatus Lloydbacteria bacterium RIFCSPHIGHO2_01_FULL_49_22 TaxID=1798658 RepID=A0A1G2CTG7_9BACT|nr:MAG: hypothetical protein A2845_05255 [Candidatus Lloydbacteria bacterium RIFCSPHIGHO2_01_FULL_49_22]OGZ09168.1 MAG: hypothetical protein A3C14_04260 [Candidatus Lloydbacteria bacterium RIFCSPHIGHO2_02_FULL_50_18]